MVLRGKPVGEQDVADQRRAFRHPKEAPSPPREGASSRSRAFVVCNLMDARCKPSIRIGWNCIFIRPNLNHPYRYAIVAYMTTMNFGSDDVVLLPGDARYRCERALHQPRTKIETIIRVNA